MNAAYWITPTRMERVRIWLTMNLLRLAWRTLPTRHPGWRGIFAAARAIKDPVLTENTRPEFEFTKPAFDDLCRQMIELGHEQERERLAAEVEQLDCAHRCGVGPEIASKLRGTDGVDACQKCGAKRGEKCAGDWTTCEGSAAHLARPAGVMASHESKENDRG